jgi:hypothetical protein
MSCPLKQYFIRFYLLKYEISYLPDFNVVLNDASFSHQEYLNRNSFPDYKTVEEYWDSLVEYEGAILKARELWDSVRPLYTKLHKYVALRLKGADSVGKPLPVHLLSKFITILLRFFNSDPNISW